MKYKKNDTNIAIHAISTIESITIKWIGIQNAFKVNRNSV
ncbi:MAG: hypothetical protein PWQ51_2009 [Methanolobus sp.]|jgi:hypothetical protein|nr:hypothetical protein [Methanolobus sp.]MDK2939844.1 hypothetical protein [Methanolobus sp.]